MIRPGSLPQNVHQENGFNHHKLKLVDNPEISVIILLVYNGFMVYDSIKIFYKNSSVAALFIDISFYHNRKIEFLAGERKSSNLVSKIKK